MAILSLRTASFRNVADAEIDTAGQDIFLVGENGQGKTNVLEALYFCSYASSFRGVKDGDMARRGESAFSASALLGPLCRENAAVSRITVKVEKIRKSINLDGKKIEDRKDLLELVPCVAFCHEDMEFVSGSHERRRWFFDQTQSLHDPVYLDDLRRYRRVLKTRNAVLREAKISGDYRRGTELLDALDPQLAGCGVRLMEKRSVAAERFSSVFGPLYEEVASLAGLEVVYAPSWKSGGLSSGVSPPEEIIRRLAEKRPGDLAQGISLSGPHRDRYLFLRRHKSLHGASPGALSGDVTDDPAAGRARDFSIEASTGQRRLLALLLRVAQARRFSDLSGKAPVLLLDDVLLELDGEKRRRFLSVMPAYEQAFFTFLPEEPYQKYGKPGTLIYRVDGGVISPLSEA